VTDKTQQPDQNIGPKVIFRRKTEGGASESLKQGADDLRLYNVVDFKLLHRKQQLAGHVADSAVGVSHDGGEKELALRTSAQAARDPRQENLAASVSYDLWRLSCEMPDAPHLCENSSPP
jgi:hypothetical protein